MLPAYHLTTILPTKSHSSASFNYRGALSMLPDPIWARFCPVVHPSEGAEAIDATNGGAKVAGGV